MKRRRDLEPARELARRREVTAVGLLAVVGRQMQDSMERVLTLRRYRDEYASRLSQVSGLRSAVLLKDARRFLAKLEQGIIQADENTRQLRELCSQREREWTATRIRTRALDKLVERREADIAERLASQEQQEQDEHASRR